MHATTRCETNTTQQLLQVRQMIRMFRVGEVAKQLSVHRDTVQKWCREGALKAIRLPNGHYRISLAEIELFVSRAMLRARDEDERRVA